MPGLRSIRDPHYFRFFVSATNRQPSNGCARFLGSRNTWLCPAPSARSLTQRSRHRQLVSCRSIHRLYCCVDCIAAECLLKQTYHGSCHCKAVTFEADIDLVNGTGKCNCTFCWKQRMWKTAPIMPGDFRLLTGADALSDYGSSGDFGEQHHRFCQRCGIATHNDGDMPMLGGPFVMVHVAALDDLSPEDLRAAPVRCADGLHDAWQNEPQAAWHL